MIWKPPKHWVLEEDYEAEEGWEEETISPLQKYAPEGWVLEREPEPEVEPEPEKKPGLFQRAVNWITGDIEPISEKEVHEARYMGLEDAGKPKGKKEPVSKPHKPGFVTGKKITSKEELQDLLPPYMTEDMAKRVASGEVYEELSKYKKQKAEAARKKADEKRKTEDIVGKTIGSIEGKPRPQFEDIAEDLFMTAASDVPERYVKKSGEIKQEETKKIEKPQEDREDVKLSSKGEIWKEGKKAVARNTLYSLKMLMDMGEERRRELMAQAPPRRLRVTSGWTPPTAVKPEIRDAILAATASEMLAMDPNFRMSDSFIDNLIFTAPQLISQALTGIFTGPVGGTTAMFLQITGGKYEELIDEGLTPKKATQGAIMSGLVQTPLEWIGFAKGLKLFKLRNSMLTKLRNLGEAVGTEYMTEFSQEFADELITFWSLNPDKNKLEGFDHLLDNLGEIAKRGHMAGLVAATMPFTLGTASEATHGLAGRIAKATAPKMTNSEKNAINRFCDMYLAGDLNEAQLRVLREEWPDGSVVQKGLDKLIDAVESDRLANESAIANISEQESKLNDQLANIETQKEYADELVDQQVESDQELEKEYMQEPEVDKEAERAAEIKEGVAKEAAEIKKKYPGVTEKQAEKLAAEPVEYKKRYEEIKQTYPKMTHQQVSDIVAEEIEAKEDPLPKRMSDMSTMQWKELADALEEPGEVTKDIYDRFNFDLALENKDWAKDTKVVNKKGMPLVMYRGMSKAISTEELRPSQKERATLGAGFYFTEDARYASLYPSGKKGANVMPVYLDIKNPFIAKYTGIKKGDDNFKFLMNNGEKATSLLRDRGYDGTLLIDQSTGVIKEAIAYDRSQIRSIFAKPGATEQQSIGKVEETKLEPEFDLAIKKELFKAIAIKDPETGRVYTGKPGQIHFMLRNELPEKVMNRVSFKDFGFIDATTGKYISKGEAAAQLKRGEVESIEMRRMGELVEPELDLVSKTFPKPTKELKARWDKAVEIGKAATGKLPAKINYQGLFPKTGHPDDSRSVIFTVESGPLKGDTLGIDVNIVSDEAINGLYQGRLLQKKLEIEEAKGQVAHDIADIRKRIARGALHEQMPGYNDELEKVGAYRVRGYSIRHTNRFFVGKGKIYGQPKKSDTSKTVRKTHPLIGRVEYTEYHDKDGNLILNAPILPVNPRKRQAELDRLIKENIDHANWYQDWNDFTTKLNESRMNSNEIAKRIKIQGILSAGRSPRSNQLHYTIVMNQLEAGQELQSGPGTKIAAYDAKKIMNIWTGKDKDTNTLEERMLEYGNKVGAFMHLGLMPTDPKAVVVDRHIARLWGYDVTRSHLKDKNTGESIYHDQFAVVPAVKKLIDKDTIAAAKRNGLTGGQAQAALWFAARPDLAQVGSFRESVQVKPSKYLPVEEFKSTTEPSAMIIHWEEGDKGAIVPSPLLGRSHMYSKEVDARRDARTAVTDYVPFSDWYMAGVRPEPMVPVGKKPHVVKVPYNQIYDLAKDKLGFWAAAHKRVKNDKGAFQGNNSYLINAVAHLIRETDDYLGFSTGHATGKWFHLFETVRVEPEAEVTIALSDVVESVQDIPQDITELDAMLPEVIPKLETDLINSIKEHNYPIRVQHGDPTIARFEGVTTGLLEYGLALKVTGPLSAIRAFASDAVGLKKAQRNIFLMHNEKPANGVKITFKVKKGLTPKSIRTTLESIGIKDFNIVKDKLGYNIDQFVHKDETELAKKLFDAYDKIGVPDSMYDYPIHSEVLGDVDWTGELESSVNDYMKHITEFFGEEKGREISESAIDEGEKYSGLTGLRKGYVLGSIASEERLAEGKAAPLRRALRVRKPETKPAFTQERFQFDLSGRKGLVTQARYGKDERVTISDEAALKDIGKSLNVTDIKVTDPVSQEHKAIDRVVKELGIKSVWYKSEQGKGVRGFADPLSPNTVYLNTLGEADHSMMVTAGHEIFHTWQHEHPKEWAELAGVLGKYVRKPAFDQFSKSIKEIYASYGREVSQGQIISEYCASFAGEQFETRAFWDELAKRDRGLAAKVADALNKLLGKIKDIVLGYDDTLWSNYFANIDKTRSMLVDVYAEYSKELRAKKPAYIKSPVQETMFDITQSTHKDKEYKAFIDKKMGRTRETLKDKVLEWNDKEFKNWRTRMMDKLHPLKMLDEKLGISDRQMSAYIQARMETGTPAIMQTWLREGGLAWDGFAPTVTKRNSGFFKLIKDMGEDADLFFQWKVAQRAEKLLGEGREHWFTLEDINRIKDKVSGKNFKIFDIKYRSLNKEVLDFAEASGIINSEGREVWEHDEYIPFYRLATEENAEDEFLTGPKRKKKFVDSQIKKLRGADTKIGDPIENILTNWTHLIRESMRNLTRKKSLLYMDKAGFANLIKPAGKTGIAWEYMSDEDQKRRVVGWWNKEGILNFMEDGKKVYYRIKDAELFNALYGLDTAGFDNLLIKAMGKAKRLLTWGVTIAPAFRIANFMRDTIHTAVVSNSFMPFVDSMKGFYKSMTDHEDKIQMMASGGGFAQGYVRSDDPQAMTHFIDRIVKEGDKSKRTTLNTFSKVVDYWEKIGDAAENAARIQLFANLKAKGETTLIAGFEAKDLLDFSLSGNAGIVQYLIRVTPFLNARVQGLYRLGRGYQDNKPAFLLKGSAVALASLALWWLNKDDERYKELPDHEKFMYYHWWIGDHHFRLPKPFEVGAIFSTFPEVMGDVLSGNEKSKHIIDYIGATVRDTFNIDIFPQMIKPAVEVWLNKNFFTDRPIIGASIEGLKPGLRADPWTSSSLKMLGETIGVSPKEMEHIVRGYLGFFGEAVLAGTDVLYENMTDGPEPPAKRFDDNFFLGRFIRESPQRTTKFMHDFYDMVKQSDELTKTINNYRKTGDHDKAKQLAKDERWLKKHRGRINSLRAYLRRTNARMRKIYFDAKMSPNEKKIAINKILDKRNKKMVEKYNGWAGEF